MLKQSNVIPINRAQQSDASLDALLDAATITPKSNEADAGNAKLFAAQHRDKLKYCKSRGGWFIWSGKHWCADPDDQIMAYAIKTADSLLSEIDLAKDLDAKEAASRRYVSAHRIASLHAMIDIARHKLAVNANIFDRDPFALNCSNWTIDLRTGRLKKHNPADLITKLLALEYDPKATAPRWEKFLAEVLPDKALRAYVQRAIGYSLTAEQREQCFFIAVGSGANGKGVFFKTLRAAIGPYGTSARPELLIHKHFENTNNEDLACLRGQRLVEVSETNKSHELNEQQVKSLTGEDFITASLKYQSLKGTEFVPTHTIWLRTNTKPKIYGTDPAIWRRPKIILFPLRFVAAFEYRALVASNASLAASLRILDSGLSDALRAELQGVLAWAVKGAALWWNKGAPDLRTPSIVTSAIEEYRSDEDRLGRFIDECCSRDETVTTTLKLIYPIYRKWAEAKGIKPWSDATLSTHLEAAGFKKSRTMTGSQFTGLKLNPSANETTAASLEAVKSKNRKFKK